jgi:hypothetical protein
MPTYQGCCKQSLRAAVVQLTNSTRRSLRQERKYAGFLHKILTKWETGQRQRPVLFNLSRNPGPQNLRGLILPRTDQAVPVLRRPAWRPCRTRAEPPAAKLGSASLTTCARHPYKAVVTMPSIGLPPVDLFFLTIRQHRIVYIGRPGGTDATIFCASLLT